MGDLLDLRTLIDDFAGKSKSRLDGDDYAMGIILFA